MSKNVLLTITGPSLTGKTTLAEELMVQNEEFKTVVTHTTRKPRLGEVDGKSYHFVTKEQFRELLAKDGFVEWAEVGPGPKEDKTNKELYGASRMAVEKVMSEGKVPLFVIEPKGAANVYQFAINNNYKILQIFLSNTRDVLLKRLLERFQNDKLATVESTQKRLINMLDVEPNEWIKPALDGTHRYDMIIEHFNHNQQEVIDSIMTNLRNLDKKPKLR